MLCCIEPVRGGEVMCVCVKVNALKAICPATLDVLLAVLGGGTTSGPSSAQREHLACLKHLVLQCLVKMVHILHTCNPEEVSQWPLCAVHTGKTAWVLSINYALSALAQEL